jgi:hypothetical protein
MQKCILEERIITVKEARMQIKECTNEDAAVETRRAEKCQKHTKMQPDDTTAVASACSRQNMHRFEQVIEF